MGVQLISWLAFLSHQVLRGMKPSLYVCRFDNAKDYSAGKRFRFAVVDLDKPSGFPSNFICMLPIQINGKSKFETSFRQIFGDDSIQQARSLLTDGLKAEEEPEVRVEIERRLKLLDPETVGEIRCTGCGKPFRAQRIRRHRANFCEECMKKKFGSRE